VASEDPHGYRFDLVLQGDGETVFLEHRRTQD
jgi:protocatechuate 3,4-dioxygenase beta subunit